MKKIISLMAVVVFALTFSLAYAAERGPVGNGTADFRGGSYDTFEIGQGAAQKGSTVESSAAGSRRLVERDNGKLYNGITEFSGRSYDTFEIDAPAPKSRTVEGSAAGSLRQDLAGKESTVSSYDLFEIGR